MGLKVIMTLSSKDESSVHAHEAMILWSAVEQYLSCLREKKAKKN